MSASSSSAAATQDPKVAFSKLELDARLVKALRAQNMEHATLIQGAAIPLVLRGRDVLAKAKTGSGKTLAYLLPMIHSILVDVESASGDADDNKAILGLVLVPSAELVKQVVAVVKKVTQYCAKLVPACGVSSETPVSSHLPRLRERPRLLVATPGTLATHLRQGNLSLAGLKLLAVDEADLLLSYGFDKDMHAIAKRLPPVYQALLFSATLEGSVEALNALLLHDPAIVRIEDDVGAAAAPDGDAAAAAEPKLREFAAKCSARDKYLILYALIKLAILPGKTLVFVNTVEKCFRVKLLLERFGLNAAVLNADLPVNSRLSVISQFNRDLFDILIATDESVADFDNSRPLVAPGSRPAKKSRARDDGAAPAQVDADADAEGNDDNDDDNDDQGNDGADADDPTAHHDDDDDDDTGGKKKRKRTIVNEFSAARGVDFVGVENVINFDVPASVSAYMHRIGRTARAGTSGVALTLIGNELRSERNWGEVINQAREMLGAELKPFDFRTASIEGLRYRVDDVLSTIGHRAITSARSASIKRELINSQRLKAHFQDNPRELQLLKHNAPVDRARVREHLTFLPRYLLPDPSKSAEINANAVRMRGRALRSRERHAEYRARKKHNRKTHGLKPFKPKNDDDKPFNDAQNELGLKRGNSVDKGVRDSRPQFRRMKKGGFV